MTKILISSSIGVRCISATAGQKLFSMVSELLESETLIDLDFSGVDLFASPFFNHSLGKLYVNYQKEDLDKAIIISNLNEVGSLILKKVIENSLNFKNPKDLSIALDQLLKDQEKE